MYLNTVLTIVPDMECGPGKAACRLFTNMPRTIIMFSPTPSNYPLPMNILWPGPNPHFYHSSVTPFQGFLRVALKSWRVTGVTGFIQNNSYTWKSGHHAIYQSLLRIRESGTESSVIDSRSDHICGVNL